MGAGQFAAVGWEAKQKTKTNMQHAAKVAKPSRQEMLSQKQLDHAE